MSNPVESIAGKVVVTTGRHLVSARQSGAGELRGRRHRRDCAVNRHGGDVTLVELPSIGIHCNTHVAMSDLNNVDIANLLAVWLQQKRLDQ